MSFRPGPGVSACVALLTSAVLVLLITGCPGRDVPGPTTPTSGPDPADSGGDSETGRDPDPGAEAEPAEPAPKPQE